MAIVLSVSLLILNAVQLLALKLLCLIVQL